MVLGGDVDSGRQWTETSALRFLCPVPTHTAAPIAAVTPVVAASTPDPTAACGCAAKHKRHRVGAQSIPETDSSLQIAADLACQCTLVSAVCSSCVLVFQDPMHFIIRRTTTQRQLLNAVMVNQRCHPQLRQQREGRPVL